ncbi:MAG: hypothetical protein ACQCN3_05935 [Candidatus Bathyarchaeia archaeon]|jgi:hypothetical protein
MTEKQQVQLSPELAQNLQALGARVQTLQIAQSDMMTALNGVLQAFALKVDTLQKENVELKGKLQDKA